MPGVGTVCRSHGRNRRQQVQSSQQSGQEFHQRQTEASHAGDRIHFKSEKILACEDANISPMVAKTVTSRATHDNRFGRTDFICDAQGNEYICPVGDRLIWRFARVENGLKLHRYRCSNCQQCQLKEKCTPSTERRISRWEHEETRLYVGRWETCPRLMLQVCQVNLNPTFLHSLGRRGRSQKG